MQFDARTAKLLKPGERIIVDGCPGLRLEASATTRTWIYRYKSPTDGNMRQVAIGRWPAMSAVAAATEWAVLRSKRDSGVDLSKEKKAARSKAAAPKAETYTVAAVCRDYIAGHIKLRRKAKGAAEVERLFKKLLAPIADQEAATLKRSQAFSLLEGLVETPVQAQQIRQELGAAWDYVLDAGRLPEDTPNWWRLIMRGRLKSKGKRIEGKHIGVTKRFLSDAEAGELIRWLPNFSKAICDVLTLYLWTGSRGAEVVQMEHCEITEEVDGLWWTLPKAKTKNARHELATDLRVPLGGRAEAVVRRRMLLSKGFLFPSAAAKGYLSQKAVQTAVHYHQPYSKTTPKNVRPRLTVTHWSPHDLRRTVRTMLAAMGCPDEVAEALLGHMPEGIKAVYNRHSYDKERRLWLTRLAEHLEVLASTPLPRVG
ncbi:tyrosine-type recombinase/integrase [Rhodoferax sp. WC2427]|uniref:tyrosine-type recombinase/integrase n=1 Tax=Rhodoferax sp. WC2427 TaxID=3234144 RepID=UPI0034659A18